MLRGNMQQVMCSHLRCLEVLRGLALEVWSVRGAWPGVDCILLALWVKLRAL